MSGNDSILYTELPQTTRYSKYAHFHSCCSQLTFDLRYILAVNLIEVWMSSTHDDFVLQVLVTLSSVINSLELPSITGSQHKIFYLSANYFRLMRRLYR